MKQVEGSPVPPPLERSEETTRQSIGVPASPRRSRNGIWMAAGAGLVLISGLAAVSIASSLSNRVDVLAATRTIAEGELIAEGDLEAVSVAVGDDVAAIFPDGETDLIGQTATGPIGAGSIVHPAQFISGNAKDQPTVVVGAALKPGQYPRVGLRPGDMVKVIEVSGPDSAFQESTTGPREITEAEVVEVFVLVQTDTLLVSLRVNEAVATPLSERAEQGRVSLAQIESGIPEDLVEPLDPVDPVEPGEPSDGGS